MHMPTFNLTLTYHTTQPPGEAQHMPYPAENKKRKNQVRAFKDIMFVHQREK